ncbi:MAG: SAM-dependent chlorinase/fluorinase [Gemmatimonadetes bacterium]|nr:SAM-dependent chlorinase/fluorinase [Gemmatimonadota bacterium]
MRPTITLLTDFGTPDGYVAEMKGVIRSLAPDADIVDATHDIPPQDAARARLSLARYWQRFPAGTVHVAVVDPGVGTRRAALAVSAAGRFLVGPDNGILSAALLHPDAYSVELDVPLGAAPTFQGRDVFAPAAARLARGEPIEILGRAHRNSVVMRTPEPVRSDARTVQGEVIAVDRFGNAITNIERVIGFVVRVGRLSAPVVRTFADVGVGAACALVGSAGLLEIAVRDGSASAQLGLAVGAPVTLSAD